MVATRSSGTAATLRRVEDCPSRADVSPRPDGEIARCRLAEEPFGDAGVPIPVPRAACEACSSTALPGPGRPNEVVASSIFARAEEILRAGGCAGCTPERAAGIRRRAEPELAIIWTTPNHPDREGDVPGLRSIVDVIDHGVTCETFTRHLRASEPFAYLRYGDGEWLSMLGEAGRNSDGQDFAPETLGRELRGTLESAADLWPDDRRLYMGIHAGWYQHAIRRHLVESRLAYRLHWVGDNIFSWGLNDLSTLGFLLAVRDFPGPKVLVANETLAPIARGLGCRHIVVPIVDSHTELDAIEERCRSLGPSLVLCCAGMTSEPLLCRLRRGNPEGTYVDCGSVFDAMVGRRTRRYTQEDQDGVLATLSRYYAPILLGGAEGGAG